MSEILPLRRVPKVIAGFAYPLERLVDTARAAQYAKVLAIATANSPLVYDVLPYNFPG